MIVWTHAVLGVLCACVLYFCICTCSAQLSMFYMEMSSRNTIIIIIVVVVIIIVIIIIIIIVIITIERPTEPYCLASLMVTWVRRPSGKRQTWVRTPLFPWGFSQVMSFLPLRNTYSTDFSAWRLAFYGQRWDGLARCQCTVTG